LGYLFSCGKIIYGQKPSERLKHNIGDNMSRFFEIIRPDSTWTFLKERSSDILIALEVKRMNLELCGKIFLVKGASSDENEHDACVVLEVDNNFRCLCKKIEVVMTKSLVGQGHKLINLKKGADKLLKAYRLKAFNNLTDENNLLVYTVEEIKGTKSNLMASSNILNDNPHENIEVIRKEKKKDGQGGELKTIKNKNKNDDFDKKNNNDNKVINTKKRSIEKVGGIQNEQTKKGKKNSNNVSTIGHSMKEKITKGLITICTYVI
jgi:hypothetical protein